MAIKFIGKDEPKAAATVTAKAPPKATREPAAAAKDEASAGADLFSADAKAPASRRKRK
ncbi:MAG TPA: hypothetical protein VIZ90_17485 [Rhizobiaceae bacterium]